MGRRERKSGFCSLVGCIRNPERLCMIITAVGCLLCMISAFVDRWRIDNTGMQNWEALYGTGSADLSKWGLTFKERTYGLMHVKGKNRNSWKAQAQSACTYRDINAFASIGQSIVTMAKEWNLNACKDSTTDACSSAPTTHLSVRCEEYGNMDRAGMLTVAFTMIGIFLTMGSLLAGLQCKKERVGGVVFGCMFLAAFLIVIFNVVWAIRSDASFKRIMESAWYPYPVLGVAYYLHLFGGLFMLTSAIFYGIIVLPEVTKFDPLQRAIERREKRLMDAKVNQAKQQHMMQQQQQGQMLMMHQQVAPPVMMVVQQEPMYVQPGPVMMGGNMQGGMMVQSGGPTTFGSPTTMTVQEQQHQYQMPAAPPSGF